MLVPEVLKLIENFFKLFFAVGVIILVGIIVYLGIRYIVSGKTETVQQIHKKWWYILIGAVLIFLSLTIPRIIGLFFNIDIRILR